MPFNPSSVEPSTLRVFDDSSAARVGETITFDAVDQYALQADNFALAILGLGDMPMTLDDSIANMRVIDALKRSALSGGWETHV